MLTRTDAEGVTTSYTHDAMGNQLSEVVYRTDEFGAQVKVERTQKYDVLNRAVMDTDALGHTAVTECDPLGRVTARVDRRGFRSVTEYDELGQLSAMRYADGTHDSYLRRGGPRPRPTVRAPGWDYVLTLPPPSP
ncbi:MAG: RHS repeat protein [Deltaproteobacteria bacterium]|nr:RHS repeat protein [Deltaproteobacteria bacterium]